MIENDKRLKKIIEKFTESIPPSTKVKYEFEKENDQLISALAELGVALTDNNGEYCSTTDVLTTISDTWDDVSVGCFAYWDKE